MNHKIIDNVIASLREHIEDKDDKEIKRENFQEIKLIKTDQNIVFIDGGSAGIVTAPDISLQFIRLCCNVYKNNVRVKCFTKEFFSVIKAKESYFKAEIFGYREFKSESLVFGRHIEIEEVNNCIRRCAELFVANEMIAFFGKGDSIIIDGNLEHNSGNERGYLEKLFNNAKERGIIIMGLAKRTSLRANSGHSFAYILNQVKGKWYYLFDKGSEFVTFFVKFNEKSEYIFRVDVINGFDVGLVLAQLSLNSNDPAFYGYPYGLIDADKIARISNREKDYLKTLVFTKIGKKQGILNLYENVLNCHSILDKLSF